MKIIFISLVFCCAIANAQTKLHVIIREGDTKKITPAMICITDLNTGEIHVPPSGEIAGRPTHPNDFFEGILYDTDKNWVGPVRKMSGKGEVNGERTYVYNPNPSLPYWKEPVAYQVSGDFVINISPGKWRISAEHGNEYIPVSKEIIIRPNESSKKITLTFDRWINLPQLGWYSGDVHTHHPLNKEIFREYMLQFAKAEDVHVLNVLEMGDNKGTYFTPEGYGKKFWHSLDNYWICTGQEDPRSIYGHVIGLNGDHIVRDTAHYNDYKIIFDSIHKKSDALAGFAHFAYGGEGVKEGMPMVVSTGEIDFVELLQNTKMDTAAYYKYLNNGYRIAAAAGSDFPWGSTVGDGRTYVYAGNKPGEKFTPAAWFKGLRSGCTFVSNGPALFLKADKQQPGSRISKHKNEFITLNARAVSNSNIGIIDKLIIINNNGILSEIRNPSNKDSIQIHLNHQVKETEWIVAAVYCKNGALAHTSPIYFEVN